LKEKVLAAVRSGIKTVLYPRGNEKDLQDIPSYVTGKVDLVPVAHLDEVFALAFKESKPLKEGKSRARVKNGSRRSALGRVK
jgi:ATP-dependent Lon protease